MKIGYHAVYDQDYFDALHYAQAHSFDYVQFDLNVPRFYLERLSAHEITAIRLYTEQSGVRVSFHAPGDYIGLFTDYPAIRKGILEHFTTIINIAESLDAMHLTVHPLSYPTFRRADTLQDSFATEYADYFRRVFSENLRTLADVSPHIPICVENWKFTPLAIETLQQLFEDQVPVYLTFDIAKCYTAYFEVDTQVEQFMLAHQMHIKELHIHDRNKAGQTHLRIGQGDINFARFHRFLTSEQVVITIEVRPREEALKTKEALLEMLDKG